MHLIPQYLENNVQPQSPALAFGMFFDGWVQQRGQLKVGDSRRHEAFKVIREAGASTFAKDVGKALRARTESLLHGTGDGTLTWTGTLSAPLAIGLGNEHPLENGFTFTVPHGLPTIPGSSVKGTLRRAAEELALLEEDSKGWTLSDVWYVFGYDANADLEVKAHDPEVFAWIRPLVVDAIESIWRKDERPTFEDALHVLVKPKASDLSGEYKTLVRSIHYRGALVCHDAVVAPKLRTDVMTPHYGAYYKGDGPPSDDGSPTPIQFLTIEPGARITVALEWKPPLWPDDARSPGIDKHGWQALMRAALDHAGEWVGFGAKTAVGYGRVRPSGADGTLEKGRMGSGQALAEGVETWTGARLAYVANRREIEVTHPNGETARAGQDDAKRFLDSFPEDVRERLTQKKKKNRTVGNVTARIKRTGNLLRIVEITLPNRGGTSGGKR